MRALILLLFVTSALTGRPASAAEIESSSVMHNLDLRNCFQNHCIQMRAALAESGNFTPLMSLKDVKLDYYTDGKKVSYSSLNGYIDYERNVVLIKVSSKREMLFSLSDLSVKIYKLQ